MSDLTYKEQLIISFMIMDEGFFFEAVGSIQKEYFEDDSLALLGQEIVEHFETTNTVPDATVLRVKVGEKYPKDKRDKIIAALDDVEKITVDYGKHREWMITETDKWIKNNAMKQAIIKSVDLVEAEDYGNIEINIRDALMSGIKSDIGLVYFDKIKERILRLQAFLRNRIPTGFTTLDKIMNGGLYVPSLTVFLGKINIGKSLILTNLARQFSNQGKNVALITMEIPEDLMAQRIDAHFTGNDINELYLSTTKIKKLLTMVKSIRDENGEIYIKEFPPAMTTVNDIRKYLNELKIMGKRVDVIMVDYINLIGAAGGNDNMYIDKKRIAEELRALSFIWKAPLITVSQLNRDGYFKDFDEIDIENSSESMGIPAAADFMGIIGKEEDLTYTNEMAVKVIKNRMGSKDGIGIVKFYLNPFSLRLFDSEKEFIDSFDESGGAPALVADDQENQIKNRGESGSIRNTSSRKTKKKKSSDDNFFMED